MSVVRIDGAQGEGGGQILRSSLALSILTGRPLHLTNLRAGRERPGLLRQHRCAVQAAAAICDGETSDLALGATEIHFRPGRVRPDTYTFDIGSAGSTALVLQTVLWPLALASAPSRLKIDGGTHNPMAPPFPFLERAFAPRVRALGPGLTLALARPGYYPAGGGRIVADIHPVERLSPLFLDARGPIEDLRVYAEVASLPDHIARREVVAVCQALRLPLGAGQVRFGPEGSGPGNAVWIEAVAGSGVEVFTAFGERAVRAETVSKRVVAEARAWLDAEVPVGPFLADQLLLPLAIAGGGCFRTMAPTPHTRTHADVIAAFLDQRVEMRPIGAAWEIEVVST